jgi:phage shock protein A
METDKMIERDAQEVLGTLGESVDRIAAAAVQLEKTIAWLEDRHAAIAGEVHHVSAEVDVQVPSHIQPARIEARPNIEAAYEAIAGPSRGQTQLDRRETDLERRLEEAENQIAELRAQASQTTGRYSAQSATAATPARKTLPAIATAFLAKHGLQGVESIEAGTLDAALTGLSLEQRIAVKSQLLRAGALV